MRITCDNSLKKAETGISLAIPEISTEVPLLVLALSGLYQVIQI